MNSSRFAFHAACVALLLIMLAQIAFASPMQSAAFDESYTLTYGYAYLRTGEARLSRGQNPPLTNVLIALPLLLRDDIAFPSDHPTWAAGDVYGFSDEFVWKANADPQRLVLLARFPEMALALLLACVVYAFTRSTFGEPAALAALFLSAFDPNLIAHGHIAGTDLGVTLFIFAAVWMWTVALRRASWRYAIVAGLLAGAALATKYSAVWLAPMALVIGLAYPVSTTKAPGHSIRGEWLFRLKLLIIFGLAAFAVIWATFRFSFGPLAPGGAPLPAPDYWASLTDVRNRVESGTPAFMLGHISPTGFPLYYPFVFLVKTPLPTLLLLGVGLVGLFARRDRRALIVAFPPALFLLAALLSNLSLGYRLIMPILPFALVIAGRGAAALLAGWELGGVQTTDGADGTDVAIASNQSVFNRVHTAPANTARPVRREAPGARKRGGCRRPWFRIAAALGAIWLALDTLSIAPNHLAYFNSLAGNRERDYELLVDSNLDWGQDLIALRDWMNVQRIDTLHLSYFGTAHPSAYGVRADLLPGFALNEFGPEVEGFNAAAPEPGWYAISATSLQLGLLYTHWDLYAPFRARAPEARIGRSILAYQIDYPSSAADRAVVLGVAAGELDLETLGGNPDRQLIVKWAGPDAVVLDMHGPARYVARGGQPLAGFAPEVHTALIAQAQQLGSDASGQLRLFEIDARAALETQLAAWVQSEVATPDGLRLQLPIEFEGGLQLLGYSLDASAGSINLVTYWQAYRRVTPRLSLFAHLLDAAGRLLAQDDGLNVRLSALEPDDIVLQQSAIDHPAGAVFIDLGLYDPTDGRRMLTQTSHEQLRLTLPDVP
ncbi:MAG TPA: glycosyltransferase family 39 protein [Anaerolineae bacterium]|nr:glycosyltransferase family 39 protein [Anaerolineae bacterium]